jgi:DNA-binding NarL/FixJ family response regulator
MSAMEEDDSNSEGKSERPIGERAGSIPSEIANLTTREIEVLKWVTEGKRDSEIATVLGVSVRTINKHVQSILSKLNVETRTAAARYVARAVSPVSGDAAHGEDGKEGEQAQFPTES